MKFTDSRLNTANIIIWDENGTDVTNDLFADSIRGYIPFADTYIVSSIDWLKDSLDPELSEIDGIENMETFFEDTPCNNFGLADINFFDFKQLKNVRDLINRRGSKYDALAKLTHEWIDSHFNELTAGEQRFIVECDYDAVTDWFANCDNIDDVKNIIAEFKLEEEDV